MEHYFPARATTTACTAANMFSQFSSAVVGAGITAILSVASLWRMFTYSGSLSWMAFWLLLLVMALSRYLGRKELRYERKRVAANSEATSMMYQFLQGISKLRIAGA